jgi:SpoVK/Ycf46/Vps4 family AAA+-type ATPase
MNLLKHLGVHAGLREDADVLFILTTNRPDQIEPALISRAASIRRLSFRCRTRRDARSLRRSMLAAWRFPKS